MNINKHLFRTFDEEMPIIKHKKSNSIHTYEARPMPNLIQPSMAQHTGACKAHVG